MRWSFKAHAAFAGGLSSLLLLAAAIRALLPGDVALPGARPLMVAGFACVFPLFSVAIVRMTRVRSTRAMNALALRRLPVAVRTGLGVLFIGGIALSFAASARTGGLSDAEVRDGRYYALDDARPTHHVIEISRRQYEASRAAEEQAGLAGAAAFLGAAAGLALLGGELRRGPAAVERDGAPSPTAG
ncbi:hypothetical protein ACFXDJ_08540 [Streptomyces sp. NPDC059443]|uniref:hypothetical protein n=1 Tax=unclassified Streptomyces TaxID=2593676 RepID=UPI0036AE0CC6